jgi:putative transposase/transposase-like zinc-binding protein
VADIFRKYGEAHRAAHPLPRAQLRVMRAIETCRTAVLGGHIEQCSNGHCRYQRNAYNSCRNRHCPKCQGLARTQWRESRQAELLPVEYFHVVFTLPEQVAELVFYNQEVLYGILFRAVSETLLTIGADPKHLGAQLGFFAILHTWGQNLLFHPHLHVVVPGGGLSPDSQRFVLCRGRRFFLPVKVLSALFRRLFLEALEDTFYQQRLQFHGSIAHLRDACLFHDYLYATGNLDWVVYAKPPFGGPAHVLKYLARYTHRVAISNQRLLALKDGQVSFQWKDYREREQQQPSKTLTIAADEFIRRFLLHTLPPGFQRIRYFGFLANRCRKEKLALCRQLLRGTRSDLLPSATACAELRKTLAEPFLPLCPKCQLGHMRRIARLRAYRWPAIPPPDSS